MLPRLLPRTRLLPDLTGGRVLSRVGVADHAVTPKVALDGFRLAWRLLRRSGGRTPALPPHKDCRKPEAASGR